MVFCCCILLAEAYECDGLTPSFVNREIVEVKCLYRIYFDVWELETINGKFKIFDLRPRSLDTSRYSFEHEYYYWWYRKRQNVYVLSEQNTQHQPS